MPQTSKPDVIIMLPASAPTSCLAHPKHQAKLLYKYPRRAVSKSRVIKPRCATGSSGRTHCLHVGSLGALTRRSALIEVRLRVVGQVSDSISKVFRKVVRLVVCNCSTSSPTLSSALLTAPASRSPPSSGRVMVEVVGFLNTIHDSADQIGRGPGGPLDRGAGECIVPVETKADISIHIRGQVAHDDEVGNANGACSDSRLRYVSQHNKANVQNKGYPRR
jgi:hypothetical protein